MMARMPLVATAALSPATLHEAFSAAFADYLIPLALTPSQWDGFLRRQGVDLDLGRALLEGGEVQGLALVAPRPAIGRWRLATMGLRPAARGSGAAATLIDDLLQRAGDADLQAVELEVFAQNPRALRLYERLGFARRHELHGWQRGPGGPAVAAAEVAPQPVDADSALAWLQDVDGQLADLPLQVSARVIEALPVAWSAWRLGSAQLVFSVDAQAGVLLRSLIDREPAQRDAEALVRACIAAHPGLAISMPPLQRRDLGGDALQRCGFERQSLHQLLMLRSLR